MEVSVMSTLQELLPWFLQYGYVAIFGFMFLSELYIPIPSNITLLAAGILSHISEGGVHLNFFIAAAVAFLASVAGDSLAYVVSRAFTSKKRREKLEAKHASYRKVEKYLKKHPRATIAVTRFIGFLSPAVNTLSGFSKLAFSRFITGDIIGNAVCVLLYMGVGYVAESLTGNLVSLLSLGVGILVALTVLYIGTIIFLRRE